MGLIGKLNWHDSYYVTTFILIFKSSTHFGKFLAGFQDHYVFPAIYLLSGFFIFRDFGYVYSTLPDSHHHHHPPPPPPPIHTPTLLGVNTRSFKPYKLPSHGLLVLYLLVCVLSYPKPPQGDFIITHHHIFSHITGTHCLTHMERIISGLSVTNSRYYVSTWLRVAIEVLLPPRVL